MLQFFNLKFLTLIRSHLVEIVIVLLSVSIYKLYGEMRTMEREHSKFKTEVNEQVLIKLVESTQAINQSTQALQRISNVLDQKTN